MEIREFEVRVTYPLFPVFTGEQFDFDFDLYK